jgi:hypothetical protein
MSANGDIVGTLLRRAFRGLGGVYIQPIYDCNMSEEPKRRMANLYSTYICHGGRHPYEMASENPWLDHEKTTISLANRI